MRLMEIEMEMDMSKTIGVEKVESKEICGLTKEEVMIAGPCVAVIGKIMHDHADLIPDTILVYLWDHLEEMAAVSRKLVNVYGEEKRKASPSSLADLP